MTPDNIEYLPMWKANATPYERLMEVAAIARKHPHRFNRLVVVYTEDVGGADVIRYATNGNNTLELIGLLRLAEREVLSTTDGDQ